MTGKPLCGGAPTGGGAARNLRCFPEKHSYSAHRAAKPNTAFANLIFHDSLSRKHTGSKINKRRDRNFGRHPLGVFEFQFPLARLKRSFDDDGSKDVE